MKSFQSLTRSVLAIGVLATAVHAQSAVRIVGPTSTLTYSNLQQAVDAAVDGDVLLLGSGTHSGCTIQGKSVALMGLPGATISGAIALANLGPDQWTLLSDLSVVSNDPMKPALSIGNSAGTVHVQRCALKGWQAPLPSNFGGFVLRDGTAAARLQNAQKVQFVACTLQGGAGEGAEFPLVSGTTCGNGASGLWASGSIASTHDCSVAGGKGGTLHADTAALQDSSAGFGAPGIDLASSEHYASKCSVAGGDGGQVSRTISWNMSGADGARVDVDSVIDTLESTFDGGFGTPAGLPVTGPGFFTELPGDARQIALVTPGQQAGVAAANVPLVVDAAGLTGDAVRVVRAFKPDHRLAVPVLSVWMLAPYAYMPLLNATITAANGQVSFAIAPAAVPPAHSHRLHWIQGMFGAPGNTRLAAGLAVLGLSPTVGPDCNANGVSDFIDVALSGLDANHNLIPDTCAGG